jgi:hypothetical protein
VARSKDALREWQRHRSKGEKRSVGLSGQALERAMSSLIVTHPEFVKGARRPRSLQPRSLWAAASAGKRTGKAKG